jgi:hypothetical protein
LKIIKSTHIEVLMETKYTNTEKIIIVLPLISSRSRNVLCWENKENTTIPEIDRN